LLEYLSSVALLTDWNCGWSRRPMRNVLPLEPSMRNDGGGGGEGCNGGVTMMTVVEGVGADDG
jgi:hypothetical protein